MRNVLSMEQNSDRRNDGMWGLKVDNAAYRSEDKSKHNGTLHEASNGGENIIVIVASLH